LPSRRTQSYAILEWLLLTDATPGFQLKSWKPGLKNALGGVVDTVPIVPGEDDLDAEDAEANRRDQAWMFDVPTTGGCEGAAGSHDQTGLSPSHAGVVVGQGCSS
jgi:hypothetical protein